MLVTYPALFYFDDSEDIKFYVHFPDFENSATQGRDITEAMQMASDWLGTMLSSLIESGEALPTPTLINTLSLVDDDPFKEDVDFEHTYNLERSFVSMVAVDVNRYLSDMTPIKKTLTIPKWADTAGKKLRLNFSQTLTEAIATIVARQKLVDVER